MREKDLRDQQRFDAQQKALTDALLAAEKAVAAALTAANNAVIKAEIANEKRLDGVNEFRRTVEDLTLHLMTKAETIPQLDAIREKLGDLTNRFNIANGRGLGAAQLFGYTIGAASLGGFIVLLVKDFGLH